MVLLVTEELTGYCTIYVDKVVQVPRVQLHRQLHSTNDLWVL